MALLVMGLSACGTVSLEASQGYDHVVPSGDGIGKVYMGREIAQVMGHEGAYWLERPSRSLEERPQVAIDQLPLEPDMVIADIGAGTGYISFMLASRVPEGEVLAVDIQPEMLDLLDAQREEQGIANVIPVEGRPDDPQLPPDSIDMAIMVDAYHEFEYPREMMLGIKASLKPGGRVVLAEYRAENPLIMIKRLHKMSEAQVKREMTAIGLEWEKTEEFLPQQHLLFFQKPA